MTTTKRKTQPKNQSDIRKLTPQEYGVWRYALATCEPDGTFHQTAAKICETIEASPRNIRRYLSRLATSGHLIMIKPKYKDNNGWWIPAKYKVIYEWKDKTHVVLGGLSRVMMKVGGQ